MICIETGTVTFFIEILTNKIHRSLAPPTKCIELFTYSLPREMIATYSMHKIFLLGVTNYIDLSWETNNLHKRCF